MIKRALAILTSVLFLTIIHTWLIHAMDMRIMHDDMAMPQSSLFTQKDDIFCSKSLNSKDESCFQEIAESKWIASWAYKILEIFQFAFFIAFALFSIIAILARKPEPIRLISSWPPKNSYLWMYWIVRNLN